MKPKRVLSNFQSSLDTPRRANKPDFNAQNSGKYSVSALVPHLGGSHQSKQEGFRCLIANPRDPPFWANWECGENTSFLAWFRSWGIAVPPKLR